MLYVKEKLGLVNRTHESALQFFDLTSPLSYSRNMSCFSKKMKPTLSSVKEPPINEDSSPMSSSFERPSLSVNPSAFRYFVIDLYEECYVDFEYVVYYAPRVSGFLGYDSVSNLEGVQIRSYLI
ncbi:hypothetical protein ZIOFF_018724 [Zingiber officinale]|uniref:Uncharacterized protein n=1 Tax=Zingiber officinale TaxID=94328 RepID=A0A8J5H8N2_ZINOF|nr:hypothetical protein ZIOFF_018724 [Zingiber officinale]